jgi:putative ABC transport system permease protein
MHGLIQSLRYTLRVLLKSPGFTITAVLILGFGIGANTAIFSLIDAVLLRPLPYPNSERLVQVSQVLPDSASTWFDYPDYQDLCSAQRSFEDLAVIRTWHFDLSGQGDPVRLTGGYVSASFFKVFCTPFLLGRPLTEGEDTPGGPLVAIINERIWRTRFNADLRIIGKNITLDNQSCLVIGVAPAQIEDWTAGLDVLIPLNAMPVFGDHGLLVRANHRLDCYGRLREGVTLHKAQAECDIIQENLTERYPETDKGYSIRTAPLLRSSVSDYTSTLLLLGIAVACLLLIACANVANLFLARSLERRREMNVRAAIGASRFRLIGQLLVESTCLSVLGGVIGILIAVWTIGFIKVLSPQQDLARFERVNLDLTALVFCFGATMLTSLLFGLFPALNLSKLDLGLALKEEGCSSITGPQRQRLQSLLITAQVALAFILLIAAGLLARSFQATQNIPLGFEPHGLLAIQIELPSIRYKGDGRSLTFFENLLEKVRRLPGVSTVALNPDPPFNDWSGLEPFGVVGTSDADQGQEPTLEWQPVTPGYFRTLGIPLLAGQDFDDDDLQQSRRVVIIDQAMAQSLFPDQNPIGKQIHDYNERYYGSERRYFTIIGVAKNIRHDSPDTQPADFQAYFPFGLGLRDGILLVRSNGDPLVLVPAVRKAVASIDPTVALSKVGTFDGWIGKKFVTRRLGMLLVSLFSGIALFLSAIGLYGVLAYSVGQRRREIGVRVALGAQPGNILRLITEQGLKIVGAGLIVGLLASLILVRFIEGILYGVTATDPFSLCAAVIVLGFAALVACLLPALRATRINPITALRE